jgi:hypothetical protein
MTDPADMLFLVLTHVLPILKKSFFEYSYLIRFPEHSHHNGIKIS